MENAIASSERGRQRERERERDKILNSDLTQRQSDTGFEKHIIKLCCWP